MYNDKLNDIVNKYNHTYHSTNKMKSIKVKSSIHIVFIKQTNEKELKFKIGDVVRISKCKNIFAKVYNLNWSVEVSIH